MSRLDPLRGGLFDIAILGGGLTGAAALRDASLRGFRTVLIETADYGMDQWPRRVGAAAAIAEGRGVMEIRAAARECETLQWMAPHLLRTVELIVPFYDLTLFREWRAAALSRWFAPDQRRPFPPAGLLREVPALRPEALQGGLILSDTLLESPSRLALENVCDAQRRGGAALNYVEAVATEGADATSLRIRDRTVADEAELRARIVIGGAADPRPIARCALAPFTSRSICLLTRNGDVLFQADPLPEISAYSGPATLELDALLAPLAQYTACQAEVLWTAPAPAAFPSQPARITFAAGDPVLHRLRAERAINQAAKLLGSNARSVEAPFPTPGPEDAVRRAAVNEQCCYLEDFMRRRSTLSLNADQGLSHAPAIASQLAGHLGWSKGRTEAELIHYHQWALATRDAMRRRARLNRG